MNLSATDLVELADLAVSAARSAGEMIATSRPTAFQRKDGKGSLASQVVTATDRASEEIILDILAPTLERYELGLLTEEREDDGGRLTADYFWCIDPLDGTLPFIEGTPGYAVSIALVGNDGTPWIGAIYDPVERTQAHAIRGGGAFRNGSPWTAESEPAGPRGVRETGGEVLSIYTDRSFAKLDDHDAIVDVLQQIARERGLAGVQLEEGAGAVLNAYGVLTNAPACYFKFPKPSGGGSLWDFAATACLFHEVGGVATDMRGDPLDLNRPDSTFMNHRGVLFATDEALAEQLRTLRSI